MTQIKGILLFYIYSSCKKDLRGILWTQGEITLFLLYKDSVKEFKVNFQGNGVYRPEEFS